MYKKRPAWGILLGMQNDLHTLAPKHLCDRIAGALRAVEQRQAGLAMEFSEGEYGSAGFVYLLLFVD